MTNDCVCEFFLELCHMLWTAVQAFGMHGTGYTLFHSRQRNVVSSRLGQYFPPISWVLAPAKLQQQVKHPIIHKYCNVFIITFEANTRVYIYFIDFCWTTGAISLLAMQIERHKESRRFPFILSAQFAFYCCRVLTHFFLRSHHWIIQHLRYWVVASLRENTSSFVFRTRP